MSFSIFSDSKNENLFEIKVYCTQSVKQKLFSMKRATEKCRLMQTQNSPFLALLTLLAYNEKKEQKPIMGRITCTPT